MPRITDTMLTAHKGMDTLVVRTTTRVEDLPMWIGQSFGRIAAYLGELHEQMADVPFVAYHNMDMQALDVEIGFSVARPLPGKGDIRAGVIPAGLMVSCLYQGNYAEMKPTYDEMAGWIEANGCVPSGVAYECYYNGTEYPANLLLTRIMMPVSRA